jgi:dihydrodipicolinate synthase/N-acetylneuraminate lyase
MKSKNPYRGVVVPMVTPLKEDRSVDGEGVKRLVNLLLDSGASPFAGGTTGEGVSLSVSQKEDLIDLTVRAIDGKTQVYAGLSGNSLPELAEAARRFAALGADVVVACVPGYYPLSDQAVLRFFEELADACPVPLFIYNIPATTHYSIPLRLLDQLSYHPNIAGLKDSERDQNRLDQALALWKDREDFAHLTGWAARSAEALQKGSDGIVPGTGNIDPASYAALYRAVREGNQAEAEALQQRTGRLSALYQKDRSLSESLVALKVILSVLGICGTQVMPPLYRMDREEEIRYRTMVEKELEELQ